MQSEKLALSLVDYLILATMLFISVAIGVYFQCVGKKTNEEYLLAGRDMSIVPVTFSLMATFMSATNIMGLPADIYLHGTNMAFMNVGFIVGCILSAYVFLPIFCNNHFTTAYEYLEKRFGKFIRRVVSAMFAVQIVLLTAATLYAPALALSAVTDLSLWMSIVTIGVVCTFYCTLGGMKAVLWTDMFQAFLMYTTLIVIIIMGCWTLGLSDIFEIANSGGRLVFPSLKFDFSKHYTFYNIVAQSMILVLSLFGGSQIAVQRLMAVRTMERSRMVSFLFIPLLVIFQLLCCMCGLVFYAYFRSCDPMTSPSRPIHSADQLMPYFITSSMSHLPGLPGLCVAGIFSASLSTVSSAVNSLAAVTYEDFVEPLFPKAAKNPVLYTKLLSLAYGCMCIALSFIMASLGNLIKLSILIVGTFAGPNLAVFLLATCTTVANQEGVLIGLGGGLIVASFLSFNPNRKPEPPLPLSNECPLVEKSLTAQNATTVTFTEDGPFPLAYMWFSSVGLLTCLVVGYLTSVIINLIRGKAPTVHVLLLSPWRGWFSRKNNDTGKTMTGIKKDCVTKL